LLKTSTAARHCRIARVMQKLVVAPRALSELVRRGYADVGITGADGGCFSNASRLAVVFAGGCVVGDVSVVSGVVSAVGAVSGPRGGYPVAIDLGEVVGHHL
jgi:hypothetical protein